MVSRVLITGVGGQVGSDLLPAIHQSGADYRIVDIQSAEKSAAWPSLCASLGETGAWRGRWIQADATAATEMRSLVRDFKPDVTFHLVAILSARGEKNPDLCWQVNVESLRVLMDELALQSSPDRRPRLLCPSSIAAFGPVPGFDRGYPPSATPNEFPLLPRTMYGVTKVVTELMGDYYARARGVDFRSVRYPGLLNASPPGGGSSDYANMMYMAAARGEPSVEVFVRPDATIPFMYMPDAIRALLELADAPEAALTRRTYNIAAMSPSARDIAESIRRTVPGFEVTYRPDTLRQPIVDSWPDALDDLPARRDWGWRPRFDLDAMTTDLMRAFRALG